MSELAGARVLVIDDDELSREVLSLLLGGSGYRVTVASSGDAAMEMLRGGGERPELVLSDLQMPGLSGERLAAELRAACGPETRLIAMSGSRPGAETTGAFDAFLQKPFSVEEMEELLLGGEGGADGPAVEARADEVLEPGIFAGFAGMMKPEALGELYGTCVRDAATQLAEMRLAAIAGADADLQSLAHAMKGSLGMVGARELQALSAALENKVTNDDYLTTLDQFEAALHRLRRILGARGVELSV